MRIFEAIAHASLGGEMDHPIEFFARKRGLDCDAISQVGTDEAVLGALGATEFIELGKAGFFERRIVVIIDNVEPNDTVAALDQTPGNMIADKAGSAGDKDLHETFSTASSCG